MLTQIPHGFFWNAGVEEILSRSYGWWRRASGAMSCTSTVTIARETVLVKSRGGNGAGIWLIFHVSVIRLQQWSRSVFVVADETTLAYVLPSMVAVDLLAPSRLKWAQVTGPESRVTPECLLAAVFVLRCLLSGFLEGSRQQAAGSRRVLDWTRNRA